VKKFFWDKKEEGTAVKFQHRITTNFQQCIVTYTPKTSYLLTDILDATNVCVKIGSFCKYYAVSESFMQWLGGCAWNQFILSGNSFTVGFLLLYHKKTSAKLHQCAFDDLLIFG
jgi:hypothetical protein